MLSQTVEYALRAAVYLADQAPEPRTNEQIAAVTRVPQAYLSKVMQSLARASLVKSQRGVHGGFLLSRPSDRITILEVVNAVDPIQRIKTCPLELPGHGVNLCPLHRRLDNALATVEEAFQATTLAEILNEPTQSVPLCNMAPNAQRAAL
jgi:Rrf2 family transcriptional regulator, nitric oxide-sensitive transcriptional repressor